MSDIKEADWWWMIVSKCHLESLMFLNKETRPSAYSTFCSNNKEIVSIERIPCFAEPPSMQTIFRLTDSGNIRIQHQQGSHGGGRVIKSSSSLIETRLGVWWSLFEMLDIFFIEREEKRSSIAKVSLTNCQVSLYKRAQT